MLGVLQPLLETGNVYLAVLNARVCCAKVILGGGEFLSQLFNYVLALGNLRLRVAMG